MNVHSNKLLMEEISDKKKKIFESALELIHAHGFHGAPMSLIAQKAEVATGTIYHYFENKEQLICQLYAYNRKRIAEVVAESLEEKASFKDKFIKMWQSIYSFYIDHSSILVFFEQYINSPFNDKKWEDDIKDRPLHDFIVEGIKSGTLKDVKPEIILVLVISSCISMAKLHLYKSAELDQKDLDHVINMVWEGLTKK